ncbi:Brevican core protein, partial [Varanus komodoensis]
IVLIPRYPIQNPREACYGDMDGFPGVRNYGVVDPEDMYDVYCYTEELYGARIRHVKDRVERLVHSGGHQPLLVIHVGTNDVARQGVGGTTRDFEALGKKLRELKAQVAFSSILPVRGFGPGRDRRASKVNDWLRVWCQKERFGFLDHGTHFLANGLLARDGLHLTRMGKRSFGDALASVIRKTLN